MTTDAAGNLVLEQSEPPVTAGALAARLGVSNQTVRNWARDGMPGAGRNDQGHPLYDAAACRAWAAAEKGLGDRTVGKRGATGGKREGTGRKKSGTAGRREAGPLIAEAEAAERARENLSAEARARRERLMAGAGTAEELFASPEQGGLSAAEASRAKVLQEVQKLRMENEARAGKLLEAAEVEAVWTRALTRVRKELDGLAAKAAGPVLLALQVGPEKTSLVQRIIAEHVNRLIAGLSEAGKAAA